MNLKINNLVFGYNSIPILDGMSFTVTAREIVAIIGPNGTGKSTLIKCIDGLLRIRAGSVSVNGRSTGDMGRFEMARQFGYVPQKSTVLFPFSVFDMVLLGRHPHKEKREKKLEKVVEALRLLGIEDLAMKNFNEISGGQQQKVSIARAIAQEADILLLDEATSNLDIRHQLEVMDILRLTVDQRKTTAILIMHDLNLTARYADKVILLNKGAIVDIGSPASVLTPENIALVYGVKARVADINGTLCVIPLHPL